MSEPRKVRVLTRLKINEVSAVDRGAGEQCKIMISKRDDDYKPAPLTVEERARAKIIGRTAFRDQEDIERREKRDAEDGRSIYYDLVTGRTPCVEIYGLAKAGDQGDEATPASNNVVSKKPQSISLDLADGITRMSFPSEKALATWLAVQQRIRKSTLEDSTTMPINLSDIVKAHGVVALAKYMVEQNSSFGATEAGLVDLATQDAHRRYPGSTPEIAFAKLYEESDDLRGAIEVAKSAAFRDVMTVEIEKDSRDAMDELNKIGKERWPSLTPAQRFARAFETNPELAKRAHRRPGPSTSFPHPTAKAFPRVNVDGVTLKPQYVTETNPVSPEAALAQLRAIGRQKWPTASEAQSFLNAITDVENADLVRRALARPTGSSPPRQ